MPVAPADLIDYQRQDIEALIARFAAANEGHATPVPGLSVARITAPVPPTAQLDAACLCVCVRGSRHVSSGDTVIRHEENHFVLTAVERPSIIAIPDASPEHPYTALRIDLDLDLARQVMADIDMERLDFAPVDATGDVIELDADMLDAVARLVRLLERPGDIAFLSRLIHREILYRLLCGQGGGRLRRIVRMGSQGHRVARAVAWLRMHFRERLRIEQLAAKAGMGVSTLHRHFAELTGMSPIQFQKQLRLHEARRLLLEDDTAVSTVALRVGYESATQFIREYRRLFGESPLRDVTLLKRSGSGRAPL
ncbi:AraC family transcriptional regulator N-terminal domain-containing protein [Luteibacter sp. CQ10]|uniref:AraC family transcriptional regulator n=1 Tax=Luteibacter sp. CQ10 TaxID=2805821 RepID=UPI0034A469E3